MLRKKLVQRYKKQISQFRLRKSKTKLEKLLMTRKFRTQTTLNRLSKKVTCFMIKMRTEK